MHHSTRAYLSLTKSNNESRELELLLGWHISMLSNRSLFTLIRLIVALSIIALTALIYFQSDSLNYALELSAFVGDCHYYLSCNSKKYLRTNITEKHARIS